MRIDEICQLYLEDIKRDNGVWVFDINADCDMKVKTKAAKRLVPIHPTLIDLGLLVRTEHLREHNESRLFPELRKGRDGYSQGASKWFGRFKKRCGITAEGKCFHSLRKTASNRLLQARVPKEHRDDLLGHDNGSEMSDRYREAVRSLGLYQDIKQLEYQLEHPRWAGSDK